MLLYNEGADAASIQYLESFLDMTLPNDYVMFLQQYNGAYLRDGEYLSFSVKDVEDVLMLGSLYPIGDVIRKRNIYSDELPKNAFIIGDEYGSGFLVMVSGVGDEDGIYFWDTSMFLKDSTDEDSSYRICDSFSLFLNSLEVLE